MLQRGMEGTGIIHSGVAATTGCIFNRHSHIRRNISTRANQNCLHCYVLLLTVDYGWLLWLLSFLQAISPNVTFMLTETTENRHENDSCPVFLITNYSVIHNERIKRLYRMTDFFCGLPNSRKAQPIGRQHFTRTAENSDFCAQFF